jgi:TPR repeat protein
MGACATLGTWQIDDPATTDRAVALLDRACDGGARFACTSLGEHFLARDVQRGEVLLELACAAFEGRACFILGLRQRATGEPYLARACLADHLPACVVLADRFADLHHAVSLYDHACRHGLAAGCLGRARQVVLGRVDATEASGLRDTCHAGGGLACVALADAYLADAELESPVARAGEVLARGCQAGAALACARSGLARYYGWGAPTNRRAALRALASACDLGAALACDGISVPDLLTQGCADARECGLALEAWEGGGQGLQQLLRATARGLVHSCGDACVPRAPTPPSPAKPRAWHQTACQFAPEACAPVSAEQALVVAEDRCRRGSLAHCIAAVDELQEGEDSRYALTRACELDHGPSCAALAAEHLQRGNRQLGIEWSRRACELGHAPGCARLEAFAVSP